MGKAEIVVHRAKPRGDDFRSARRLLGVFVTVGVKAGEVIVADLLAVFSMRRCDACCVSSNYAYDQGIV